MTKATSRVLNQLVTAVSVFALTMQPIMAQTVAAGDGPVIGNAPNGVPMVMIETPNGQGVSHNRYDQFNVGPDGLLLNNISGNFDTTQLGGIIPGNANLANGGAASLILNEVVSPNPSTLAGYLEVAGARADVIVANPYGITCDGCGFLNMDRMTLATGTPTWEAGVFTGLGIDGGAIAIGENGAAARDTLRFDLLSRRISVAGAVEGQRIRVVAGRNDVVYLTDEVTPRAVDGSDAPELAIDSSVLGGMYAGSISITSTESGVGVRAPQNMAATTGDMHITADGRLVMGRASAQGQMQVQSTSSDVTVEESLAAREALEIEAARAILVETDARIVSEAALALQAGSGVTLGEGAELAAIGDLTLTTGTGDAVLGAAARVLSHGDVSVQARNIKAQADAVLLAGMARNGVAQDATLALQAVESITLSDAQAASGGDISADARIIAIAAQGDLPAGRFVAQGDIALATEQLTATGGQVIAGGNLSVTAVDTGMVIDGGSLQAGQGISIAAGQSLQVDAGLQAVAGDVALAAQGDLTLEGQALTGGSVTLQAGGDLATHAVLQAAEAIAMSARNIYNSGNVQTGAGAIDLAAGSLNNTGLIVAADDLTIFKTDSLTNAGILQSAGLLSVHGTASVVQNGASAQMIGLQGVDLVAARLTNAGTIGAVTGDMTIAMLLDVANTGLIQASAGQIDLQARDLVNTGDIVAGHDIALSLGGLFDNAGLLQAAGRMDVGVFAQLLNRADGDIVSGQSLTLQSAGIDNAGMIAAATGTLIAQSAGAVTNTGLIFGQDLLSLATDHAILNDAGILLAAGSLQIGGLNNALALSITNQRGGLIETFDGDTALAASLIENIGAEVSVSKEVDVSSISRNSGTCPSVFGFGVYRCTTNTTTTTTTTDVATSDGVASMIVSGRDLALSGGTARNMYSLISAQGDINLTLEELTNSGLSLMELTESETQSVTRRRTCLVFCVSGTTRGNIIVSDPIMQEIGAVFATITAGGSIVGEVTGYIANGAVGAGAPATGNSGNAPDLTDPDFAQIATAAPDFETLTPVAGSVTGFASGALGNTALFVSTVDPNAPFLIETRLDFVDLGRFLSSDYFLSALNYDPAMLQKRFGDAWAETLFVREQMFQLTGQGLGIGGLDPYQQMRRMYDAAVDAARSLDLTPGIALTPAQIAALTDDIIWLEEAVVNGQTVLVPRVYLASASSLAAMQSVTGGSSIRAGLDINLLAGSFVNSGAVTAGRDLALVVQGDLANLGGMLGAQNVLALDVAGTLTSFSGTIAADMVQIAARDIVIETAVVRGGDDRSYQDVAGITSTVTAGTELVMLAERGIVLTGAEVTSGGAATLVAGDGITVGALALEGQAQLDFDGGYYRAESLRHQASQIVTGAELTLFAQRGDIVLEGAVLDAGGAVGLIAQDGDVLMQAVADYSFSDMSSQGGNFISKSSVRDQRFDLAHQVSQIAGAEIDVFAAGMITAEGTRFATAGQTGDTLDALQVGDLRMTAAGGSILVSAPTAISARSYQSSSSMLGGLISSSTDIRSLNTESLRSTARVAGIIDLTAAGDLTLVAVDFEAAGILRTDVGGQTYLLAAVDTDYASSNVMRNNGVTITTTTQEDYTERATFNELRAAGFAFDEGSPVTFDAIRDPRIGATHAAALVNTGEANMAIAAMFLGDTDPATGPPSSGADDDSWRTDLDMSQIALPGVQDGPGYGYIAPLLERESTVNNAVLLIDQHYYDQQVVLNPAFKALVSIAVSAYVPGLGEVLNLGGAAGAAATAFGHSMTTGMIEGTITGNMDIGAMLENAAFSGVTSGLTAGINLPDNLGLNQDSLFGRGNLSIANLAEGGLDATITAALRTGVYGDDFVAGFSASLGSSAAGLLMADMHNIVGDNAAGLGGEGSMGHILAHAVVGCALAEMQGADCGAGAVGGAVSAYYAGYTDRAGLADDVRETAIARAELIGAVSGYFVSSGKAENVTQAAAISQSAFENNYLLHAEAVEFEALQDLLSGGECGDEASCAAAANRLMELADRRAQRALELRQACQDVRSMACQIELGELRNALVSYGGHAAMYPVLDGTHSNQSYASNLANELMGNYGREVGAVALASLPVDTLTGLINLADLISRARVGDRDALATLSAMGASAVDFVSNPAAAYRERFAEADLLEASGRIFEADVMRAQIGAELGLSFTAFQTATGTVRIGARTAPNGGVGGFYDPRAWRQNYEDFYNGNITSTTVPPFGAPNVRLAGQPHPRTDIVFDQRGFPIFDDVARYDTRFPAAAFNATDYAGQMRMATRDLRTTMANNPQLRSQFTQPQLNAIHGGRAKIPDFTWHHHQDSGRMQLVPSTTHRGTAHIGGEAMSGGQ
ncbi:MULTISPECIES: filamentous hemagglutinin N-terminal domain-containing protein [unclassified Yoonia]|uniref:two-partner secretion domain-containing protein n=1 Tax=unclassified Yoonia TaxID=2629118 RepID=UPI002AFE830F|nr:MULTISPECIES: HNH endonuclease [unclassified Yoonia]